MPPFDIFGKTYTTIFYKIHIKTSTTILKVITPNHTNCRTQEKLFKLYDLSFLTYKISTILLTDLLKGIGEVIHIKHLTQSLMVNKWQSVVVSPTFVSHLWAEPQYTPTYKHASNATLHSPPTDYMPILFPKYIFTLLTSKTPYLASLV